jgi:hypothetical protein
VVAVDRDAVAALDVQEDEVAPSSIPADSAGYD